MAYMVGVRTLAKASEFDKLLMSAIDEALNSLGESVKQSIYFHIEHKFHVARNEIPENLEEFQGGLEKIFGTGAQFKTCTRKWGAPSKCKARNSNLLNT